MNKRDVFRATLRKWRLLAEGNLDEAYDDACASCCVAAKVAGVDFLCMENCEDGCPLILAGVLTKVCTAYEVMDELEYASLAQDTEHVKRLAGIIYLELHRRMKAKNLI